MSTFGYSMPSYFQNMSTIGSPLTAANAENEAELRKIEEELSKEAQEILASEEQTNP